MLRTSVIIPVYNHEKYILGALESVFAQTYKPSTVVVIDDGSKDDSWKVICDLTKQDTKCQNILTVLHDIPFIAIKQENMGPSKARNVGIQSVFLFTEVFAFLDADDVYESEKIEASIKIFEKKPQIGLVYTDYTCMYEHTGEKIREYKEDFDPQRLVENNIVSTNSIVTREALKTAGGFNEQLRVVEDYDLWLRISEKFGCYHIPESLFKYRITDMCASKTIPSEEWSRSWAYVRAATQQRRQS